ncbi:MAG: NADH pyrophosphatase zinc ribbon domain-containing protein [Oscillospiraceae bacterium]
MLQDLYPHMYHNEMSWKAPSPDDIALIFEPDHTVYCNLSGETLTLPRMCEIPDGGEAQYAFSIDETAYYLVSAHPGETDTFRYVPSSSLRAMTDGTSPALFAAAAGESLYRWYDSQKFCGRCGARMEKSTVERAMVCPHCKNTVYPKICPAVIVAVHDGDRLLLTRYRGRPFKNMPSSRALMRSVSRLRTRCAARSWRRLASGSKTSAFTNPSRGCSRTRS